MIDGQSVEWASDRPLFFYWDRGFPEPYRNIAVRKGDYKLVGNTHPQASIGEFELFSIKDDPSESNNLIKPKKEKAIQLKDEFDAFYDQLIKSEHLSHPPRIKIGSHHENPTILNRNDAKGAPGMWNQNQIFAYWSIEIVADVTYDITASFLMNYLHLENTYFKLDQYKGA